MNQTTSTTLKVIRWTAVVLIVLIGGWLAIKTVTTQKETRAAVGGNFTLVNHLGETVSQTDFRGQPMLIYFGFAYCPDICSMALQVMGEAMAELGADARKIQPMFITIDPKRDTPEFLAEFIVSEGFPPDLIGLTGSTAQIEAVAKAYTVIYRQSPDTPDEADYLMDHSSIIYLMDADGDFVAAFSHVDNPMVLAACLSNHLSGQPCRR